MNRQQIIDQALSDLNREDKADQVDIWLRGTEMRINTALRDERMVKRAILPAASIVSLPADFLELKQQSLSVRSGSDVNNPGAVVSKIAYMPPEHIADGIANPVEPQVHGPTWFTLRGRQLEFGAWNATGNYLIELWYYGSLPALVNPTDTNWLSILAPHIYVEGVKHFGFRHLQEMDASAQSLVTMTGEINFLNEQNAKLLVPQGPLIQRPTVGFGTRYAVNRRR